MPSSKTTSADGFIESMTFEGKPDVDSLDGFSEDEVKSLLARMPKTAVIQGQKVKAALRFYEECKRDTKRLMAKHHMLAVAKKDIKGLTSAEDRKYWVLTRDEVKEAEDKELTAKIDYELEELKLKYCEDIFAAVRKTANLIEKEQGHVKDADRYGDVPF
jgi:hypothetical protein